MHLFFPIEYLFIFVIVIQIQIIVIFDDHYFKDKSILVGAFSKKIQDLKLLVVIMIMNAVKMLDLACTAFCFSVSHFC